jgi:ATP-dependent exoDNAse (exonuclease V) alpha subunit
MSELTINVRQGQDPLGGICSRLRVGELTQEDITTLNSRLLDPKNPNIDTTRFENCTWVFNTKTKVKLYNQRKTIELRQRLASIGQRMYVINSRDYIAGTRNKCPKGLLNSDNSKTGGLVSSLTLGVGSRVMLRHNIDVGLGLVNGACGEVVKLEWSLFRRVQQTEGDMPTKVFVKFEHEIPGYENNTYPIRPMSISFYGKKNVYVSREQLPLILSWAINTHKMQGVTRDMIVIDLANKLFAKGIAYVALSRCTSLQKLALSHIDVSQLLSSPGFTPFDPRAFAEMQRLRTEAQNDL